MNEKTIYQNSGFKVQLGIWVSSIIAIVVSIYLTNHYFALIFPTDEASSGVCRIGENFNCDVTSLSAAGSLFKIPTAFFGIIVGIIPLIGFVFPGKKIEGTTFVILCLNALGCLGLLFYSSFILKTFCPFCLAYYLCSFVLIYLFVRFGEHKIPDPTVLASLGLLLLAGAGIMNLQIQQKEETSTIANANYVNIVFGQKNVGEPNPGSPFRLASATENFSDAPLRISVFSDFQCSACKRFSEIIPALTAKYKGKINIQYMFFPLDPFCNSGVPYGSHLQACRAAALAVCSGEKFIATHDLIFKNQDRLETWITSYAKDHNLESCMKDEKTMSQIEEIIAQSSPFNVDATPTVIINGLKLRGAPDLGKISAVLDRLLERK